MRKIKEVLRLRFELRLGQREIARACSISQGAIHNYLKRAAAVGIAWPLPEGWDEQRVEQALFGERQVIKRLPEQVLPDFPALHSQLQQHRHLTLQLAWEEYRQVHPEGYGYSRFCGLYQRWRGKQDVVLRQVHQPGEKGFVDWAGATIPVHDPVTGEIWPASLFVMVLGASSYTYAEATRDQQLTAWISAHIHAFEYFSGVPRLLIPDNLRTGVSRELAQAVVTLPWSSFLALFVPINSAKDRAFAFQIQRFVIAAFACIEIAMLALYWKFRQVSPAFSLAAFVATLVLCIGAIIAFVAMRRTMPRA